MKYTAITEKDYDCIYRDGEHSFLCYSAKKIRKLSPTGDYRIVGMTRDYNGVDETSIDLGKEKLTVIPTERSTPRYKTVGYISIESEDGEQEYIAVQKCRNVISAKIAMMMDKFRFSI